MTTAELCMKFMRADTEDEVVDILRLQNLWDRDECWRPIGDVENNFGTIGNQQSDAIAALAEKIVNGIDARLTNACLVSGVEPTSAEAPQSIRQAVGEFFEGRPPDSEMGGRIYEWSDDEATRQGRLLTVAATGMKPDQGNPSITIADDGEGQTPDDFPVTFMSLALSNKLRIPFVQGKFNMGGTGSLQFCSRRHSLQLIVSRRNPALVDQSASERSSEWGFTIVRRKHPVQSRRSSVFEYLAPVERSSNGPGGVLSFRADTWPIFPESSSRARDAYYRQADHGSLIKLYEYNWQGSGNRSHILRGRGCLLQLIEAALPELALPVRMYECRSYRGHAGSFATNALGLVGRLERNKAENLELEPFGGVLRLEGRNIPLRIYLFKAEKADQYRAWKHGIIFTINGQMHASLRSDFFRRRRSVGMSYLADSLLVLVDCTAIDGAMREDLFMNSRDRLRENRLSIKLEGALESFIRSNAKLREIRNKRQEEATKRKLEDDKPLVEALTDALKRDPVLSRLFIQGLRLSSPFAMGGGASEGSQSKFEGRRFPTFFRFEGHQSGETLARDAHLGSRVRVAFETDAVDDYFSRDIDPGAWEVVQRNGAVASIELDCTMTDPSTGIAQLWFDRLPDGVIVGEELEYEVKVVDSSRVDAFRNSLTLRVRGSQNNTSGGNGQKTSKNRRDGDGDSGGQGSLNLPEITLVREDSWNEHRFSAESVLSVHTTPLDTDESDSKESFRHDFFVNVDNKYLRVEQKADPENSELIEKQFTYGMVIVGLALLRQDTESVSSESGPSEPKERDSDEDDVETRIGVTTAGLAPVFLPMLKIIGTLVIDES